MLLCMRVGQLDNFNFFELAELECINVSEANLQNVASILHQYPPIEGNERVHGFMYLSACSMKPS